MHGDRNISVTYRYVQDIKAERLGFRDQLNRVNLWKISGGGGNSCIGISSALHVLEDACPSSPPVPSNLSLTVRRVWICALDAQRTERDLDFDWNRNRRIVTSTGVNQSALPLHLSRSVDDDVIEDVTVPPYVDMMPRRMYNSHYTSALLSYPLFRGRCYSLAD